jgi:hypothetical protein
MGACMQSGSDYIVPIWEPVCRVENRNKVDSIGILFSRKTILYILKRKNNIQDFNKTMFRLKHVPYSGFCVSLLCKHAEF